MSEQPGATRASNSPRSKDGWGAPIKAPTLPHYTLLIPNNKAKHRSTGSGVVWKYQLHYWQNRWYVVGRPAWRKLLKRLHLK